jgi:hypothetical protein
VSEFKDKPILGVFESLAGHLEGRQNCGYVHGVGEKHALNHHLKMTTLHWQRVCSPAFLDFSVYFILSLASLVDTFGKLPFFIIYLNLFCDLCP